MEQWNDRWIEQNPRGAIEQKEAIEIEENEIKRATHVCRSQHPLALGAEGDGYTREGRINIELRHLSGASGLPCYAVALVLRCRCAGLVLKRGGLLSATPQHGAAYVRPGRQW
jgi:hypothetical protein